MTNEPLTKATAIERLLATSPDKFVGREKLEAVDLIRQEQWDIDSGSEDGFEWDRDVLIMLDEEALNMLVKGEVPDFIGGETITAQHFVPDGKKDFDKFGDLRERIHLALGTKVKIADTKESPQPRHGVIGCNWHHFDLSGILTEERFHEQLTEAIDRFADQIAQHEDPFRPVRFHSFPATQFAMAYLDWCGTEEPFDVRVIIRFGNFVEPTTNTTTAGFQFFLTTVCQWDEEAEAAEDFTPIADAA